MSEYGYVEKPILEWLAGKADDPADNGLGWKYRTNKEMDAYGRDASDPITEEVPIYRIDANYLTKVQELPTPAGRAAELEAALNKELIEGQGGLAYRKLGERLKQAIEIKERGDEYTLKLLEELENIVEEVNELKSEPERLGLKQPGEYTLFTVIREFAEDDDEATCVTATATMMQHLRQKHYLPKRWSDTIGGVKQVRLTLQLASWDFPH